MLKKTQILIEGEKLILEVLDKGTTIFKINETGNIYGKNNRNIGALSEEERDIMLNIFSKRR